MRSEALSLVAKIPLLSARIFRNVFMEGKHVWALEGLLRSAKLRRDPKRSVHGLGWKLCSNARCGSPKESLSASESSRFRLAEALETCHGAPKVEPRRSRPLAAAWSLPGLGAARPAAPAPPAARRAVDSGARGAQVVVQGLARAPAAAAAAVSAASAARAARLAAEALALGLWPRASGAASAGAAGGGAALCAGTPRGDAVALRPTGAGRLENACVLGACWVAWPRRL